MSTSFQYLLSIDPLAALVKMFNDQNYTTFRLHSFNASTPVALSSTLTQVTLTPVQPPNSFATEQAPAPITVTYDRLDLSIFLQNVLESYTVTLPASTQNILNEITALIGQQFYIDDIYLTEITRADATDYALTAKPESLRFVGSIILNLANLVPLSSIFSSTSLSGIQDSSQVIFPLTASAPYINATDFSSIAEGFAVGDLAQNQINLVTLFNNTIADPSPGTPLSAAPWTVSSTPGPFNLYNAAVVGYVSGLNVNPAIPSLESALEVSIDGAYCTNFQSGNVVIPYTAQDFQLDGYTNQPRCIDVNTVSLSNGSEWNSYLNSFIAGQIITSFQATPAIYMDGEAAWTATPGVGLPTNLAGALILYNGQIRPTDMPPATEGLDRVLQVEFSLDNSVWEGPYSFYYTSPLELTWNGFPTLKGTVGSFISVDFTPSTGDGPFSYGIAGALPPGLSISGSILSGTPTTAGTFPIQLTIIDSVGVSVVFNIQFVVGVAIAPLMLLGTLAPGVVNVPYAEFVNIAGGLMPYSGVGVSGGSLPPGLSAVLQYNTIRISGTPTQAGSYPIALQASSTDGQTAAANYTIVINPA